MEIICVPAIVSLVFSIMEVYKKIASKTNHEKTLLRIIPIIGAALGIISGVVCFFAIPEIIPATEIWTAIIIGGASGLSATGANQIIKQLKKFGIEIKGKDDGDKV